MVSRTALRLAALLAMATRHRRSPPTRNRNEPPPPFPPFFPSLPLSGRRRSNPQQQAGGGRDFFRICVRAPPAIGAFETGRSFHWPGGGDCAPWLGRTRERAWLVKEPPGAAEAGAVICVWAGAAASRWRRRVPAARGGGLGDTGLCEGEEGAERGHLPGAPGPFVVFGGAAAGARPEGGTAAPPALLSASAAGGSGGASRGGFGLWGAASGLCGFSARAKRDWAEAVVTRWPARPLRVPGASGLRPEPSVVARCGRAAGGPGPALRFHQSFLLLISFFSPHSVFPLLSFLGIAQCYGWYKRS